MAQNSDMLELLNKMKNEYYTNESKNMFFKNAQKEKCAQSISKQIDFSELLKNMAYIIPGTNKIYIDYPIFKSFANETNYGNIINYIIEKIMSCIQQYNMYEMHLNLKGFTISAAERYKSVIQLFCNQCCTSSPDATNGFSKHLINMYIYHTPSMMETIFKGFSKMIDPLIKHKILLYSKSDSDASMAVLHRV